MSDSYAIAVHVHTDGAIPGAEQFYPEPKLGNLKDAEKIAAKTQEHYQKCAAEAGENPLLAQVSTASLMLAKAVTTVHLYEVVETLELSADKGPILEQFLAQDLGKWSEARVIVGEHPTTHMRMLRNDYLRRSGGGKLPSFLTPFDSGCRIINPWYEVQKPSDGGGFQACIQALGWDTQGHLRDSLRLARVFSLF